MHSPMQTADKNFYKYLGRHINWDDPQDLNEKINWLKFHADQHEWARLADKYAVREYITERGLADILIPLYGKWDTAQSVIDAWDSLPEEFVLKSNNGCGHIFVVSSESGGKNAVDLKTLKKTLNEWLNEHDFGQKLAELHYQFIDNCIIAEKLLKDDSVKQFSNSLIDYKFHCADGRCCICYVSYDRDPITHLRFGDLYNLEWEECSDYLAHKKRGLRTLPRPKNWDEMLKIASILSKGHPQVRVDLYNVNGKIYFGEMTFTSAGGYDNEFTQECYLELGKAVRLNKSIPWNQFADKKYLRMKE